jgi:phage shock protein A
MGIMTRFTRIFKADIHGVMDQIENKELILKQCLREMEASLAKNKAKLNQLKTTLNQNRNEFRQLEREKSKSKQDLNIAIEKEKEDIARLLIKKSLKTDQHMQALSRQAESIEKKIEMMTERIEAQKHQYAELELRSESWIQKAEYRQWEESASNFMPDNSWQSISDEEVELELIKCKDAIRGGA